MKFRSLGTKIVTISALVTMLSSCKMESESKRECVDYKNQMVECPQIISLSQKHLVCREQNGKLRLDNGKHISPTDKPNFTGLTVRVDPVSTSSFSIEMKTLKGTTGWTKIHSCEK